MTGQANVGSRAAARCRATAAGRAGDPLGRVGVLFVMLVQFSGHSGPTATVRGRLQTYALVAAALAAGALLIAFGLIVLAGLAVTGTVVGGGIALYHRVTGRWPKFMHVRASMGPIGGSGSRRTDLHGLDPSKEVFADRREAPRLPRGADTDTDPER